MAARIKMGMFFFALLNALTVSQQIQYNLSASTVLIEQYHFNLSLSIFPSKRYVAINISGPSNLWFGVGFNNTVMTNTYAIICSKDSTNSPICQENKLGRNQYGQRLSQTITVLNDNTNNDIRKTYITRNITINNQSYFSFPISPLTLNIIFAVGYSDSFTQSSQMGASMGTKKINIINGLSNNLTVAPTPLGYDIMLNSIVVYPNQNIVQINITGPSSVYFGIGFNSTIMGSPMNPVYAIVCDGNGCHENQFIGHSYGTSLQPTVSVVYENTINDKRTVAFNRKCNITASDNTNFAKYFQFPVNETKISVIYAIGSSNTWCADNAMNFNTYTYGTVAIDFVKSKPIQNILYAHQILFNQVHQTIDIKVMSHNNTVNISVTGPANVWFGIGFNKTQMSNAYAIICSDEILCFEQLLSEGTSGQRFPQQHIHTISDCVTNGIRTVLVKRKQNITRNDDANYQYFFDFPSFPINIPIIYAYGTNDVFNSSVSSMAQFESGDLSFTKFDKIYNLSASLDMFASVGQSIKINVFSDNNKVTITFNGPINRWYGIGFDNTIMNDTYAIIVQGSAGNTVVQEQILGDGSPGFKLQTQYIMIESDSITNGIRTVEICRPLLVNDNKVYNFPQQPTNLNIIYAYGSNYTFDSSTFMINADSNILEFKQMANSSNQSFCVSGMVYYGTYNYVSNGLSVGLYIYCKTNTIRMQIDYVNYMSNWFGIVFNKVMTPSPNSTVFTTGKASETKRSIALYSYDLRAKDLSDIVYCPEINWRKLKQTINGQNISLIYEQDLSITPWDTSTAEITFRYAWGTADQGTQLSQHTSSDISNIYTFNLVTNTSVVSTK